MKKNEEITLAVAEKLQHALTAIEKKRLDRVEKVKAKTGQVNLPAEQRKLTQQEAAAYCGVSTATVHRWTKDGLKTVSYGKRKRFLLYDLQNYLRNKAFP